MKNIKRAVHIDFHTMPGIENFGENWNAEVFAQTLKDANVEYINAFAQCNIGFSYYPTKIGIKYPTMKGDMFGSLLSACHKHGIVVTAYINVGLNHEAARRHADWLRVDKDGRIIRGDRSANFFRTMCYNTDYREYLLKIIEEICSYDVDGIFCDCMCLEPCYCDRCTSDMKNQGIDIEDGKAVLDFAYRVMLSISEDIRKIVPKDKYLFLNGMPFYDVRNYNSHIEIECLPSGGWGYDYFGAKAAYARNINKNVLYMTGRFQSSWGDFGGYKTKASIENDFFDALCNNVGVSLGDHMHPANNLIADIYSDLRDIYKIIKTYEPWTDGCNYISEIGVLTDSGGVLSKSYMGLSRMLSELKYSFDIIHKDMDFDRFSVLILPDDMRVDNELANKLKNYLSMGKKIISSGFSGLNIEETDFALSEWDFKYKGKDSSNSPYFHFTNTPPNIADMDWAIYKPGIRMEKSDTNTVLADYIVPYFDRKWDGLHGYFYTPPKCKNKESVILINSQKNVAHVSFRIFDAYYENAMYAHKIIIDELIKLFLPNPLIRAENMPSTSRITLTGKKDYYLLHVKVTYPEPRGKFDIVEEHNILPEGKTIYIRGHFNKVLRLPDKTIMESYTENGYTVIKLPQINGYGMFCLCNK